MKHFTNTAWIAAGVAAVSLGAAFAAAETPSLVHIDDARSIEIAPMDEPGVNAFLQDVVGADDGERPITCGFFRIENSPEPLVYTYDYDETKIILDGVITVSDGQNTVEATEGDVLLLPKGVTVSFTTESEGTAYVCGARPRDTA